MNDTYRNAIVAFVETALNKAEDGAWAWSFSYHTSLGIAGVLSLIVGAVSPMTMETFLGMQKGTAIAIIALTSAALTFIAGFGGFERKWQGNRVYREELQQIKLDLANPAVDLGAIREKLREAAHHHNLAINGAGNPACPQQAEVP